jgi:hypothetical protein
MSSGVRSLMPNKCLVDSCIKKQSYSKIINFKIEFLNAP